MRNEKIELTINHPKTLTEPDLFWMVTSGEVDVFCVDIDEKGDYKSTLKYLYRVRKGELIFSLLTNETKSGYKLLIKSYQASLIAVDKNKLLNIDHFILRGLIEKWVVKNIDQICQDNPPRIYDVINPRENISLNKNRKAYPNKGISWGLVEEGEVLKYGQAKLSTAKQEVNFYFPISSHLWIESVSSKSQVRIFSTREVFEDEIFFMLALNDLQDHFYNRLLENIELEIVEEYGRMEEKFSSEHANLDNTIQQIGAIVNGVGKSKAHFEPLDGALTDNNLFAACQLIGDVVGYKFEVPKYLESYNNSVANQLNAIAQSSKVRVRKVILRGVWWKEENGHLLGFLKKGKRPVALIQKSPKVYVMKDPQTNEETVLDQNTVSELQPISYMFFYGFGEQMDSIKKLLKFAMQGVKSDAWYLVIAALLGSVIGLLIPILSGIMFDDAIPSADKSLHIEIFVVLIMIAIVTAGLQLIRGVLQIRVEAKSSVNAQAGVMDHLMRLPVTFFKKYSAGDLTNRALSINQIRQILSSTVLTAVLTGCFSIVNLVLLFYYDARLAFVGLGLVITAVFYVSIVGWLKLKYDRKISNVQGELQGFLFEFLSGIVKIRNTAGEKRIFTRWAQRFSNLKQIAFKSGNYQNIVETFNRSYPLLTSIMLFSFIYYNVTHATTAQTIISVGVFMSFITAFNRLLNDSLAMSLTIINSLNVATLYGRVKPVLEAIPESNGESNDPGELSGDIEMNSVSFRYHTEQPLVLKDVSFKVKPGEMVAFVGESGSGKSTIMRLLLGFQEPEAGAIYYDGAAFESMNKELVRRQIGVVLQNGALMAGSIYQNIVGNSELTLENAWEAARLAGLEEDIMQMPMEMHTVVSDGGGTFSGGQRQRLMIARAIVHKPRLIFMDEATSALDNRTQAIVSESLEKLQATRIIVAHRLSTIQKADRIYVLDKGQIVEFGSFDKLMEQNGVFSYLAKRQMA